MLVCVLLLLLISGGNASSSSTSSSTTSVTADVPSSIKSLLSDSLKNEIAEALATVRNLITIGRLVRVVELQSPALTSVESIIASYEASYSSLISYIERVDAGSIEVTDSTSFYSMISEHSTLAAAISTLVSIESDNNPLELAQYSLQKLMRTQSGIMQYLAQLTVEAYYSVYNAGQMIEEATIADPSIVAQVVELDLVLAPKQHVEKAIHSLALELYSFPKSVDSKIMQIISSASIVRPSIVSYISSNYPTVYSQLSYVTEFVKSHTSVISTLVAYLTAQENVAGIGSAVRTFLAQDERTLEHDISVISSVQYSWSSFLLDAASFEEWIATSPSMIKAEHTVEISFYGSPTVAAYLYSAMKSPSIVSQTTKISLQRHSHRSLIRALATIRSWEAEHSSASGFASLQSYLDNAFIKERTLLTAASRVLLAVSPTRESAEDHIRSVASVVTGLSSMLASMNQIFQYEPSLVCYEDSIARYAAYSKTLVSELWMIEYSPSQLSLSITYDESLEAEYPTLDSAIYAVESAELIYTSMVSLEETLISAMAIDSTILTDWNKAESSPSLSSTSSSSSSSSSS